MSGVRGLVLFPGAGSSANHSSLLAIESALAPLPVMRVDFPYRLAGRRAPDRAPVLVRAVCDAVQRACERWSCTSDELVIGGRSMGGRMCSMAAAGFDGNRRAPQPAQEPLGVAGVVCISYPLHPPRQPATLRVEHLPHMNVPSLFVSGTRDDFATPEELQMHLAVMPLPPEVHFIDGGRHDLRGKDDAVATIVARWLLQLPK
ncbi:MAG: alpha/beta family hydrolase [Ilumatobacteraceae bacterium]